MGPCKLKSVSGRSKFKQSDQWEGLLWSWTLDMIYLYRPNGLFVRKPNPSPCIPTTIDLYLYLHQQLLMPRQYPSYGYRNGVIDAKADDRILGQSGRWTLHKMVRRLSLSWGIRLHFRGGQRAIVCLNQHLHLTPILLSSPYTMRTFQPNRCGGSLSLSPPPSPSSSSCCCDRSGRVGGAGFHAHFTTQSHLQPVH